MADEYICLIFAAHREPLRVEVVEATDYPAAVSQALQFMNSASAHGYELWLRGKKIASYFAPPTIPDSGVGKTHNR